MKLKVFPFVVTALLLASLAVVACGAPEFQLSSLTITPPTILEDASVTVSVVVENIGSAEGTHTVNFSIGSEEFTRTVTVDADDEETASVVYTPPEPGVYTVTVDGPNELSGSFEVEPKVECATGTPAGEDDDWWWFDYEVLGGEITTYYSTANAEADLMYLAYFPATEMTIYFSKEVTDNISREIKIEGESFVSASFETKFMGADTDITLSLGERSGGQLHYMDATGILYLEDDATDADVDVIDVQGEDREFEFSGGSVVGDMVGDFPLYAYAEALGTLKIHINLPTKMTTADIYNEVTKSDPPGAGIDGSIVEATGISFCKGDSSRVADYVGTQGKIVVAATKTDMTYGPFDVDFQMLLEMDLVPK